MIQHQNDAHIKYLAPPIIKRVKEKAGLWRVPLTKHTTHNRDLPNTTSHEQEYLAHDTTTSQANSIYELSSI